MKPKRSEEDILFIIHLLESFKSFSSFINVQSIGNKSILREIAKKLCYQEISGNQILCRIGDIGDKYYIILKGSLNIFMHKEVIAELTYFDYVRYLVKLKLNNEVYLVNKMLSANHQIFNVDYSEIEMLIEQTNDESKKRQSLSPMIGSFSAKLSQIGFADYYSKNKINSLLDYFQFLEPDKTPGQVAETKRCKVFRLYEVHRLKKGDSFGEAGLQTDKSTRTATLISNEDSCFGILDKHDYNECIKEINEKVRKAKVSILFDNRVFGSIYRKPILSKLYSNNFVQQTICDKKKLVRKGEECNRLFIVKRGEFEVNVRATLKEFLRSIKTLGGRIVDLVSRDDYLNDDQVKQFVDELHAFKLKIVAQNEIVGLADLVSEGKWLFNVELVGGSAEIFSCEIRTIEMMLAKEDEVKVDKKAAEEVYKRLMVERMRDIVKAKMSLKFNNQYFGSTKKQTMDKRRIIVKSEIDATKRETKNTKMKKSDLNREIKVFELTKPLTNKEITPENEETKYKEEKRNIENLIFETAKRKRNIKAHLSTTFTNFISATKKNTVSKLYMQSGESIDLVRKERFSTAKKLAAINASRLFNREAHYSSIYSYTDYSTTAKKKARIVKINKA